MSDEISREEIAALLARGSEGMTREEAIMVLKNEQPHCGKKALFPEEKKYEAFNVAIKALEQESKTGRWIDHLEGRWMYAKCSICKTIHDAQTNYCPNCGAMMEIEDE